MAYDINDMPAEGLFLAYKPELGWLEVERYAVAKTIWGIENAVIHRQSGKWWTPDQWMPIDKEVWHANN